MDRMDHNLGRVSLVTLLLPVAILLLALPAHAQDSIPPVPGNSGIMTTTNVNTLSFPNTMTLNWTKATDNVTPQSSLQYEVRTSFSNNMGTVANAELNGFIVQGYTTNIATANVDNNDGTYFTVIVKDAAGNKAVYATTAFPSLLSLNPSSGSPGQTLGVTITGQFTHFVQGVTVVDFGTDITVNTTTVQSATVIQVNITISLIADGGQTVQITTGNERIFNNFNVSDTTPPVPGNSGVITPSSITMTSLTLTWTKANDNVSAQSTLQYEVRRSLSNNIDTVANAQANGTVIKTYTADINSFNVTGLTAGTTYYFNVVVQDELFNKAVYSTLTVTTPDTIPPTPGNSGTITTSNVTATGLSLSWTKATDNATLQSALQYEVRRSLSNNLGSVALAETNGTIVLAYTTDIGGTSVAGLSPSTTYFFNVIVKDLAGNKAVYSTVSSTTLADSIAPVPGNSGTITTSNITSTGLTLNWTKATDNAASQSALQYEVRRSLSNNLGTVANAEANGTIVQAYTADIATANATGLTSATTYFFTVIVKDTAGNKAVYSTVSATTTDSIAPVPGNSGTITTSGLTSSGVTLNWTKATDNVSAQSALQYEVRRSLSNNLDSVANAEANGTIVQAYTADIATANASGLTTATTYFFTVIVKDTAGNKAVYSTVSATTLDTISPVPGNSGTITTSGLTSSGVTLNWTKATDNVSAQSTLQYEIRRSLSNNLDSVANAEANGTIVQAYTADIATAPMGGLSASTDYFFNIIVKDAAGNKAVYTTVLVHTSAASAVRRRGQVTSQ